MVDAHINNEATENELDDALDFPMDDGSRPIFTLRALLYSLILVIGIVIILVLIRKAENGAPENEVRHNIEWESDLPVGKAADTENSDKESESDEEEIGISKEDFRKQAGKQMRQVISPDRID